MISGGNKSYLIRLNLPNIKTEIFKSSSCYDSNCMQQQLRKYNLTQAFKNQDKIVNCKFSFIHS